MCLGVLGAIVKTIKVPTLEFVLVHVVGCN